MMAVVRGKAGGEGGGGPKGECAMPHLFLYPLFCRRRQTPLLHWRIWTRGSRMHWIIPKTTTLQLIKKDVWRSKLLCSEQQHYQNGTISTETITAEKRKKQTPSTWMKFLLSVAHSHASNDLQVLNLHAVCLFQPASCVAFECMCRDILLNAISVICI